MGEMEELEMVGVEGWEVVEIFWRLLVRGGGGGGGLGRVLDCRIWVGNVDKYDRRGTDFGPGLV